MGMYFTLLSWHGINEEALLSILSSATVHPVLGQQSQAHGVVLGLSCAEPGDGLNDCCESLPVLAIYLR